MCKTINITISHKLAEAIDLLVQEGFFENHDQAILSIIEKGIIAIYIEIARKESMDRIRRVIEEKLREEVVN